MCSTHLSTSNYWPFVKQVSTEVSVLEQKLVSDVMFEYYQNFNKNNNLIFNLNNLETIKDDTFKAWFGYKKSKFTKICEFTKNCENNHVAVFLCKIWTSLSNEQLGFLFNCCSQTIANHLDKVRNDLIVNLVPQFINVMDRQTLIDHNTPMAKELYDIPDDKTSCVFDATYRLAQKSEN